MLDPCVNVNKIGTNNEPATPSDTEMLDWLQKQTKGYGLGWIVRNSVTGRGMRLHETSLPGVKPSIREAIMDAMKNLTTSA